MSALDSIIKWAEEDLRDWQSDVVRRLLLQEELTAEDKEEILGMIKERHAIKDPKHPAPKPQPLKKGDVSGAPQTTVKITLKALEDLKDVNAIPDVQLFPKASLSDILSEGEHCVVAVAGFLAELKVVNHECPIIFDDPVCSLDHNYRDRIAKRLVEEAKSRQVIVFTHDIAFLIELESKATETNGAVNFTVRTVCKVSDTVGKCIEDRPWHTMLVKDRVAYLRQELDRFKGFYETNQAEYNREAAVLYALLRETWEALVEEVLLHHTIKRHGSEIQTQRLKSVAVETPDYKTIHFGMEKCSEWMRGHDKSKALSDNRPSPREIQEDIIEVEGFRKYLNKRNEGLREEREKELEPKSAPMG